MDLQRLDIDVIDRLATRDGHIGGGYVADRDDVVGGRAPHEQTITGAKQIDGEEAVDLVKREDRVGAFLLERACFRAGRRVGQGVVARRAVHVEGIVIAHLSAAVEVDVLNSRVTHRAAEARHFGVLQVDRDRLVSGIITEEVQCIAEIGVAAPDENVVEWMPSVDVEGIVALLAHQHQALNGLDIERQEPELIFKGRHSARAGQLEPVVDDRAHVN